MASLGREGENGERWRITYRNENGKQQTLRLGVCPKRLAESALVAVEHLVIAKRHGGRQAPHHDAVSWLEGIDNTLYDRVAALGLCQPREDAEAVTLGELCKRFQASAAVKPGTRTTYAQAFTMLRDYFGDDRSIDTITRADADQWRASIAEPVTYTNADGEKTTKQLAPATIGKRTKTARALFAKAVRWGLLESNPFDHLKGGSQANPDRSHYVSITVIRAVLDACPDDQWRGIVALSRFAGLRCPSEVGLLRWSDVNWQRGRLMVRSPKTAGHEGHAVRVVPVAPELRPILQDLFDGAEDGAEWVVPRLRDPGVNLRTQLHRIIGNAGEKPWPRLLHNLRASCATDWVERFPAHVVAGWLGHSPLIAATHYLQTKDLHFSMAAGLAGGGDACGGGGDGDAGVVDAGDASECAASNPASQAASNAASNAASHTLAPNHTQNRKHAQPVVNQRVMSSGVTVCDRMKNDPMTPRGSELPQKPSGNTALSQTRGIKSGIIGHGPSPSPHHDAPPDPELAVVVESWPHLPPAIRAGIVAMVRASRSV